MRESGILLHITSLPGPYGIGTMGKSAFRFVDFLEAAGQSYWQLLPLTPTGYGDSPYQSFSSWAGNHYLIDLDLLAEEGLLTQKELRSVSWGSDPSRVDFGQLYLVRTQILQLAHSRFTPDAAYEAFLAASEDWLPDYALFMALKAENGGKPWTQWPEALKLRKPAALDKKRRELADTISFQYFLQYQFHRQWQALRRYAAEKNIRIIGDVPIYVPLDSADIWTAPELFQLDRQCRPKVVAGCPPDGFTDDGQLWGNPIYNWEKMHETAYAWWIKRLRSAAKLYDVVRIDHFRGLESYWSVPAGEPTGRNGKWVKGPGIHLIRAIQAALPELEFIAEDLGYMTKEVRQLQLDSGYPTMKVLQFGFDPREESDYLPHHYPVNSVCYTGTHDNVPMKQWFEEATAGDVAYAKAYLGLSEEEGFIWGAIRGGMSSVSRLFVAQMQDYLELGKEGRMNTPGIFSTANWTWRTAEGFDSPALAQRIRRITQLYGRLNTH